MTIVNNFINDFVDEHKVLSNAFFVENTAIVPKHFHHSVNDVHYKRRGHIVLGGGYEVDSKLLGKKEIEAFDVLLR
jgi:hypothetical protein